MVSGILTGILVSRTLSGLIASVAAVIRRERALRWTMTLGAIGFGVFTMFRTALTFLLSAPPFAYPVSVIGLFGLAGLAGALAAQRSGRLHDRGWSLPATGAAWALALVAFVVAAVAGRTVAGVLVAIVLLDIAIQSATRYRSMGQLGGRWWELAAGPQGRPRANGHICPI